jgi:hypothetical protein
MKKYKAPGANCFVSADSQEGEAGKHALLDMYPPQRFISKSPATLAGAEGEALSIGQSFGHCSLCSIQRKWVRKSNSDNEETTDFVLS